MADSEKVIQIICDGMGLSPEVNGNAFVNAPTPTFDYLLQNYPSMRLLAAGTEVGLDMGEPGNSEVGHLTLGTGQVLPQAFQIINGAIKSEAYKTNKTFLLAFERLKKTQGTLHLVGLVSSGGVHGHIDHLVALLDFAREKGVANVAVHAITDGRDSPPKVALSDIAPITQALKGFAQGVVATVGGRYYAMDRDLSWERTDAFFWAMYGKSQRTAPSFEAAVNEGYQRGESDETLLPTTIVAENGQPAAPIQSGDLVLFTNYRPDRIRQLATRVITSQPILTVVTLTDYFLEDLPRSSNGKTEVLNAFPLPKPDGTLAETLARHHKTQLHIAETEKYAHITYFFNGHIEQKRPLEEWLLIPSAKVASFDQVPQMSAGAITDAYLNARTHHEASFTVVNYANMDMVGHTGNYAAALQAVSCVDSEIKRILSVAEGDSAWLIITADHGNVEQMIDPLTGEIDKEHTTNPVPIIIVHPTLKRGRTVTKQELAAMSYVGMLADVAPTILEIFGITKPHPMVGSSLLTQLRAL